MSTKSDESIKRIEDFIDDFKSKNGIAPSVREIESGTGISKSAVARYLSYMNEQGIIEYKGSRNIETRESRRLKNEIITAPVLGSISCGIPKFAEENIEEYIRLPIALFGKGDYFILHANGDSMIDAGIHDGDLVLICKQNHAEAGQIVVALIEDEATLKRYYPEPHNHRIRLHPENKALEDIYVNSCIIQGIAAQVIVNLD